MTRARTTQSQHSDGMSMLAMAPFPAFNPLNWWALATPANALRASAHNARLMLDAMRTSADCMRAVLRAQQDAMLALIPEPGASAESIAAEADSEAAAEEFVRPMVEMTRAYGRVGKAFIVAQRDAMRAFTVSPSDQQQH